MVNTTDQFGRIGGEIKQTTKGVEFRNSQPNLVASSKGSQFTTLDQPTSILGISNARFEAIVSFFLRKGVSESLARTYGMALLEASISTGRDVTELVNLNKTGPNVFDNQTLTHINFFRNKTSQIGYNTDEVNPEHEILKRTILV